MVNVKALREELEHLVYDILDNIISPSCGIPQGSIWADPWIADIGCYTMGDEEEETKIIDAIKQKYQLDEHVNIEAYHPLYFVALTILCNPRYITKEFDNDK